MKKIHFYSFLCLALILSTAKTGLSQEKVQDGFEGNGTIATWAGDDCGLNTNFDNPYKNSNNPSEKVLEYKDSGGQYANIRFDVSSNFDLSENHTFQLKIYIPSDQLSGNQPNQVSLKLQDRNLQEPWSTQSEIIKALDTDKWQTLSFDFKNDEYINLDDHSQAPTLRTDFNRVVIQVNGENNNDEVTAYIDDFSYDGTLGSEQSFDKLVWSDEFDENGALDADKWFHQTKLPSGGSWFNGEIQHYTDRTENAVVRNGILKITARKERFTDQGVSKDYTSARLNSKFAFTYGRVEIRAKLPTGVGTWPALWMLGKNISEDGAYWETQGFGNTPWPECGEIDIMEHWGNNQDYVSSATHTPSSYGNTQNVGGQKLDGASTSFHVYSLNWSEDELVFAVDDKVHFTYRPANKNDDTWPFYKEQYLLFNVAILPSISSDFDSSAMEIDYVRVYQEETATSIQSAEEHSYIKGYPSLVKNEFSVACSPKGQEQVHLSLCDLNGRTYKGFQQHKTQEGFKLTGLSHLAKGVYVLSISSKHGIEHLRFIKE